MLARLAPQSKVIGIAIGQANLERCEAFATGLSEVLADNIDDFCRGDNGQWALASETENDPDNQ